MRIILITALLCTASLLLPGAHAQQGDADAKQLARLRAQAEQGEAQAQFELGLAFYLGKLGLAMSHVEAVRWYLKAAEQNEIMAQYNLGVCYRDGQGVATNYVEAVKWFRKAAAQNDARAQCNLGVCYQRGEGVAQDDVEAVKWYRKAAAQNLAQAKMYLGGCYFRGEGVAKDQVAAVKWWREAAAQNHAKAQHNLGVCYREGQGVAKDEVEAYKWELLAGAQGDEDGKKNVTMLERELTQKQVAEGQKRAGSFKPLEVPSLDAPQDEADGQPLAELSAKATSGDAQAQNELGVALLVGKLGAPKNTVAAVKWFRQAAEQNHPAAQSNLGLCYERGDGVAKYEVEAYKWDLLAAAQGDTKAKRNASMLELILSPEEVADGKQRAQVWLEQRKKASTNNRPGP